MLSSRRRFILAAALNSQGGFFITVGETTYVSGDTITLTSSADVTVVGAGSVEVTVVGAGGGGGGAYTFNSKGGGGGGGSGGMTTGAVSLNDGVYTAQVGVGGKAGTVSSTAADDSTDGGDSTFAGVHAGGGKRGVRTSTTGDAGAGGSGGSGDTTGNPGSTGKSAEAIYGVPAAQGGASVHPDGYGKGGNGNGFAGLMSGSVNVDVAPTNGTNGVVIIKIL